MTKLVSLLALLDICVGYAPLAIFVALWLLLKKLTRLRSLTWIALHYAIAVPAAWLSIYAVGSAHLSAHITRAHILFYSAGLAGGIASTLVALLVCYDVLGVVFAGNEEILGNLRILLSSKLFIVSA